jgi:hypothetical protein
MLRRGRLTFFVEKLPADGTLASRCHREVFGTIPVAAMFANESYTRSDGCGRLLMAGPGPLPRCLPAPGMAAYRR